MQDRAACGERICCAASRRCYNHRITAMDGETNAVDGGLDVQRPPNGCPANDHIIERMMGRPPGWHPRLEHRPLLNPAAPFENIAQAVHELTWTHFREEAEPAHINAENG